MAEQEIKDTAVMLPVEMSVVLAGETHIITPFKLGKTLRMMEYLSQLFEGGDLVAVVRAAPDGTDALWGELSARLPSLLRTARPLLLKTLALTLIPNKRLAEIDENEESYEAEIQKWVRTLKGDDGADTETALNLLVLAIDGIGFESIRKNFPKLLQRMGSR